MSAFLSIRDLAGVALPTGQAEGLFLMLRAYFDDSGTHSTSDVVVVGGLIGTVAQWTAFELLWGARIAEPLPGKPRLGMFHLSHCNARDGEFAGYSDGEQDAVIHDFRKILIDCKLISVAAAIDAKAWDELIVGETREALGSALENCVEKCLIETMRYAADHPEGDKVAVVLDKGIWTEKIKDAADRFTYPLGRPRIISITFSAVKDVYPLQGADIAATENYWHAIKIIREGRGAQPRPHLRHFLDNMIAEGLIMDRAQLCEALPEIERGARASRGQPS